MKDEQRDLDDRDEETASGPPDGHAMSVVGVSQVGAPPLSPLDHTDLTTGQGIDESTPAS